MRAVNLTVIKGGIDRLRPKGGARADNLYDLVNGYVTARQTVVVRPGTRRLANLPAGTTGLVAFNDKYHVFAPTSVNLTAFPDFQLNILLHPLDPASDLVRIHYATPFLGALYVVAEFDDGQIYHFWLQEAAAWKANAEYSANQFVTPTVPNGYVYIATRLTQPFPAWTAGAPRALNDVVEPTEYNEYYYTVIDVVGASPSSGTVEPVWPLATGATVVENADGFPAPSSNDANPPAPPSPNTPQASTTDRYDR
jgi:hypothetical protein